jgi:hypothetical protein
VSWCLLHETLTTIDLVQRMASLPGIISNYQSSEKAKCGTHVSAGETPAPPELPKTIHVVLGTLNKKSLEMEGIEPNTHFQRDHGISWVKGMVSEGDKVLGSGENLPQHPNRSSLEVV